LTQFNVAGLVIVVEFTFGYFYWKSSTTHPTLINSQSYRIVIWNHWEMN